MKKACFLLILLLTYCSSAPTRLLIPTHPPLTSTTAPTLTHSFIPTLTPDVSSMASDAVPTADLSGYQPSIESFQVGAECPHLCWLGINPGVTTAKDADKLLRASDQINQGTIQVTERGILATWFTEKTRKLASQVYVYVEKGLVKTISFQDFSPFTLKDFTNLLGDPSGINIDMEANENRMYMPYEVYYSSQVVLLESESTEIGPNSNDGLVNLILNIKYDDKNFCPWIGYGHLKEYLTCKQVH